VRAELNAIFLKERLVSPYRARLGLSIYGLVGHKRHRFGRITRHSDRATPTPTGAPERKGGIVIGHKSRWGRRAAQQCPGFRDLIEPRFRATSTSPGRRDLSELRTSGRRSARRCRIDPHARLLVRRAVVLARNRAWAAVAVPQDAGVLSDRTQLSMAAIPGPATLVGATSSECWNEVTVIAFLTRGPRVLPMEMRHTGVSDIDLMAMRAVFRIYVAVISGESESIGLRSAIVGGLYGRLPRMGQASRPRFSCSSRSSTTESPWSAASRYRLAGPGCEHRSSPKLDRSARIG